ncbi:hypothetical protein [Chitinophaga rhizosphaerae]|uniref:hypothetical protein n=1 Tax=Chitinophaga rhizosphaerae TaxID=1864947 RepID=UPI000F80A0B0|nr:hypothetical protein [Chitinophaga rhizosphaerae]
MSLLFAQRFDGHVSMAGTYSGRFKEVLFTIGGNVGVNTFQDRGDHANYLEFGVLIDGADVEAGDMGIFATSFDQNVAGKWTPKDYFLPIGRRFVEVVADIGSHMRIRNVLFSGYCRFESRVRVIHFSIDSSAAAISETEVLKSDGSFFAGDYADKAPRIAKSNPNLSSKRLLETILRTEGQQEDGMGISFGAFIGNYFVTPVKFPPEELCSSSGRSPHNCTYYRASTREQLYFEVDEKKFWMPENCRWPSTLHCERCGHRSSVPLVTIVNAGQEIILIKEDTHVNGWHQQGEGTQPS